MEEKQLYGALTVYRERGAFLRRLEQLKKAKDAYQTALENAPQDVDTLLGLSRVCADAGQSAQAYAHADAALGLEPQSMVARNMQARATYCMSEFERSLVMNYRASRRRRCPPYFIEGINNATETIEDCVGLNAGSVMLDFLPLIERLEASRPDGLEQQRPKRSPRMPVLETKAKLSQMEFRKRQTLSRVFALKYLGPMAYDKFFLQNMTKDKRLYSANAAGSAELKSFVDDILKTVGERQETLHTQRPYYSIKLAEKADSKYQNRYNEAVLTKERDISVQTIERLLCQLEKYLSVNRVCDVIAGAERVQMFLDKKTQRTLTSKEAYTDRLYRIVGEAYLSQYRLSYSLSERGNRRRVAFLMGMPVGRPSSFDSVVANYPYKFVDAEQTIEKVTATLEVAENRAMRCWLCYELAKLLFTQKNFSLAKYYAKRCQTEALESNSFTWWTNGCFALISGDMQQGNANEVRSHVEEAHEITKKLTNKEVVQAFLAKCVQIVSEPITADERKAVVQRERQVLGVMEEPERVEAGVLFKRMSTVPAGRRFSVLPTKPEAGAERAERRRLKQRGLSAVPGPERELPAPPKSRVRGFQAFDI
ncbi:Tetratricopeptide repeat protein 25 [Eumeta japonica]|uniref:Tetratricopeptide repeat protein 25 n=1 Tax=Eumeta variegata TaxID=151549 RepID=A0A4C1VKD8_EUMVA|nr:Tetratricopeptide repeat protein 25 [Eumeta japonica]